MYLTKMFIKQKIFAKLWLKTKITWYSLKSDNNPEQKSVTLKNQQQSKIRNQKFGVPQNKT